MGLYESIFTCKICDISWEGLWFSGEPFLLDYCDYCHEKVKEVDEMFKIGHKEYETALERYKELEAKLNVEYNIADYTERNKYRNYLIRPRTVFYQTYWYEALVKIQRAVKLWLKTKKSI